MFSNSLLLFHFFLELMDTEYKPIELILFYLACDMFFKARISPRLDTLKAINSSPFSFEYLIEPEFSVFVF